MYITEDNLKSELNAASDGKVELVDKQKASILQDVAQKIVGIDLQNSIFSTLQFPSLPRNWQFLMAPIDWPKKAMTNPNGSLFIDPKDIDSDDAMDIGRQCFGSARFGGKKTGLKQTLNPFAYFVKKKNTNESVMSGEQFLNMLLENSLNEDTPSQTGADIKVRSIKSQNKNSESPALDVINAITTYIVRSIQAVKPLVEMVGGNIATFQKAVNTANQASSDNIRDWLEQKNAAFQEAGNSWMKREAEQMRRQRDAFKDAYTFALCVCYQEPPKGMNKDEFTSLVYSAASTCKNEKGLKIFMKSCTSDFNGDFDDFEARFNANKGKPFKINLDGDLFKRGNANASLIVHVKSVLNERESLDDIMEDGQKKKEGPIDYDKLYTDLFTQLTTAMSECIGPRENWLCFKKIEDEMKFLKDSADKEINTKIDLVCKTTGNSHSLLKYPFKAEGLKGMWARYSSELQQRIDNRIAQLKGSTGSAETGSAAMVEDFLRNTYPQIIAMMLTYRCVFEQLKAVYKNKNIPKCSLDDLKTLTAEAQQNNAEMIRNNAQQIAQSQTTN